MEVKFQFEIGDVVTHVAMNPEQGEAQPCSVVSRGIDECYTAIQAFYLVRPLSLLPGLHPLKKSWSMTNQLFRLSEIEMKRYETPVKNLNQNES